MSKRLLGSAERITRRVRLRYPFRIVAVKERKALLQAEIDDLFASGKRQEAIALLDVYSKRYLGPDQNPDQPPQSPYRLLGEAPSDAASVAGGQAPRISIRRMSPTAAAITTPTPEEAEHVKALLTLGRGRLKLLSGNVIENGRILVANPKAQMGKSLVPLNPVLCVWLRTMNGYIPITVFNTIWLKLEQQAWSNRETQSETKILAGGTKIRMYAGTAPTDELTIEYAEWLDCITLFIKYVLADGWITLAGWLEGHKAIVTDLRESAGWMVALRYCQMVRQGVMSEAIDKEIKNISVTQERILNDAKELCEKLTKRASASNPYAPGGTCQHICLSTGLP